MHKAKPLGGIASAKFDDPDGPTMRILNLGIGQFLATADRSKSFLGNPLLRVWRIFHKQPKVESCYVQVVRDLLRMRKRSAAPGEAARQTLARRVDSHGAKSFGPPCPYPIRHDSKRRLRIARFPGPNWNRERQLGVGPQFEGAQNTGTNQIAQMTVSTRGPGRNMPPKGAG